MKNVLLTCLGLCWCALLTAQSDLATAVFFNTGQHDLTPEAQRSLESLSQRLLALPDYALDIEAYTDDRGTETYNQQLANQRAASVQAFLASKGIEPGKAAVKSWGEQNLRYGNESETERQKNRRVDVVVNTFRFQDLAALQTRLSTKSEQTHRIQPTEQQEIKASGGSVVVVPPNSFVFEDGTVPTGPVEVTVREAIKPADWILNGLTTLSDGQILQSGGMLYVEAKANGKTLTLADGARLTVALPNKQRVIDPEMQLFYGEHAPNQNGNINWQATQVAFRETYEITDIRLPIDKALKARVASLRVPVPSEPQMPRYRGLPPTPAKPASPTMPVRPTRPDWVSAQRNFGIDPNDPKPSSKKVKKAEAWMAKASADYREDSVRYEQAYVKYQQKMVQYEQALLRHAEAQTAWYAEVRRRIGEMLDYERKLYLYLYAVSLRGTVKVASKSLEAEHRNLERYVRSKNRLSTRRYLSGYDLTENYRLLPNHYYRIFSLDFVKSKAFQELERQVLRTIKPDTLDRSIDLLIKKTGIAAISDSLKDEIKQRELAAATDPTQKRRVMQAYITDIDQLGWVNVDKFAKMEGERAPLAIKETEDASMYIACKSINSILPMYRDDQGVYSINQLPKGMRVTVVSIKIKDGMPQLAMRDVVIGETPALELSYKSCSLNNLREEMQRLNG